MQFREAYEAMLFEKEPLQEDLKVEYFYFCSESEGFSELCDRKDPISMIDFFNEKLLVFKENAELREEVKKVRAVETKQNDLPGLYGAGAAGRIRHDVGA